MKIAFVVQRYGVNINGGAEQHCRQLAEKMALKHDVDVLTTTCDDYYTWNNSIPPGESDLNGVCVRRFATDCTRNNFGYDIFPGVPSAKYGFADDFNWLMQQGPVSLDLINYINYHRHQYDVFVFFTYLYFPTVAGLPMVPEKSVLIPTAHDEDAIYRPIFRQVFHLPRAIFYNTEEEMDFVHRMFHNEYICHKIGGIGFEACDRCNPDEFRNKFGISDKFILYAGRITERKGCNQLFDYFLRSDTEYKLVLIGKEDIAVPEDDRIISLGFVSDEDKNGALEACDALVIPSLYESFSMVLAEAMLRRKPVIANGGCEVLRGHCRRSCGGVYYTGFYEFEQCLGYVSDFENRRTLGDNGYRYVSDNYTWDIIVEKFETLIQEMRG